MHQEALTSEQRTRKQIGADSKLKDLKEVTHEHCKLLNREDEGDEGIALHASTNYKQGKDYHGNHKSRSIKKFN